MKTIIAGSRDIYDVELIDKESVALPWKITEVISGGDKGVDKSGETFAILYKIPTKIFPADRCKYGKSAEYIRNADMAIYADALLAIWDGKSKRTKHIIDCAIQGGLIIKVKIIK